MNGLFPQRTNRVSRHRGEWFVIVGDETAFFVTRAEAEDYIDDLSVLAALEALGEWEPGES